MNLAHLAPWALIIGGGVLAVKVGGDVWRQVHTNVSAGTAATPIAGHVCPHFCTQMTCGCGAAA
jgi:hypothetical protein